MVRRVAIAREAFCFVYPRDCRQEKALTWFYYFGSSFAMTSMISSTFVTVSIIVAAAGPAKVSDVKSNTSAMPAAKPPRMIYVNSFSLSQATKSDDTQAPGGGERPRLLGALRGGEQETIIGQHREEQKEETLGKLPGALQKALVADLSQSIAPATSGNGPHAPPDCWIITGEFLEVDAGSRALQAGVGFGAGQSHLEVRAKVYSARDLNRPFLTFDSQGASGHMPGAVMTKNPYVAAAKFVMSKREPEREAKKVASSIAHEIGKFMTAQGIATLKSMKGNGEAPARVTSPTTSPANGSR
jgi:hypothetical protein